MKNWRLPIIDLQRCTRCGLCVTMCPTGAVEMQEERPRIVRPDDCTFCTQCEVVCPEQAIRCEFEITWAE